MKKIVDETHIDEGSEENDTIANSDVEGWDIEDRLYEQYKEMKIEGSLDDSQGKNED